MPARVAIVMYHDLTAGERRGLYTVTAARFARDLSLACTPGGVHVQFTFDDATAGIFVHGMPRLLESGARATVFVPTQLLGQPGYMDRAMLREWHAHGLGVGSHGVTHRSLTGLAEDEVRRELSESRARLQDLLGASVDEFSVPSGNDDARVRALALEHYGRVYTSRPGFAHAGDRLLPRFIVRERTSPDALRWLHRGRTGWLFAGDRVRWAAKRALGVPLYIALRRTVRRAYPRSVPGVGRQS